MFFPKLLTFNIEYAQNAYNQILHKLTFYDSEVSHYMNLEIMYEFVKATYDRLREAPSNLGRCDFIIKARDKSHAFIIEVKKQLNNETVEKIAFSALKQIQEKDYESSIRHENYKYVHHVALVIYKTEDGPKTAIRFKNQNYLEYNNMTNYLLEVKEKV